VKTLTKLDECFARGELRPVPPSGEKAIESLRAARAFLDESRQAARIGSNRLATGGIYMAWFHASRAVLFRDGIREKSHYCIGRYLETYVSSGRLDRKWVTLFDRIRTKRTENQYSFGVPPAPEEIDGLILLAEQFTGVIQDLLDNP
jgi:uncharacterized protein (UPF0332 family)